MRVKRKRRGVDTKSATQYELRFCWFRQQSTSVVVTKAVWANAPFRWKECAVCS
jgi:hypothetical protein